MNTPNDPFEFALSGQYNLSVKGLFERANTLTKKSLLPMVQGFLLIFAILFIASSIFTNYYGITTLEQLLSLPQEQSSVINIVLTLVMAPFITGLIMMGIYNARSKPITLTTMFGFLSQSLLLAVASLLVSIFITLGLGLLILPGLYLYLTTKLTLPLIADQKLSPHRAIFMSVKILHRYVFHILIITLIFAALMILVFMTFGLAFIWVGPLYFNVFGLLYEDLIGTPTKRNNGDTSADQGQHDEARFDA